MDAERLRAKTLEAYRQGPDSIVALVAGLVAELAVSGHRVRGRAKAALAQM